MICILHYVNGVYHGDRCVDVELSLHSWNTSHLIIVYDILTDCLIWFADILLRIVASVLIFIRDISP